MIKPIHVVIIATTLSGTFFCMEEKKATISRTLTQRNTVIKIAEAPQLSSSQEPQELLAQEPSFTRQLKGECYNCLCTILCCGSVCTIASYCVKHVLQSLEKNS